MTGRKDSDAEAIGQIVAVLSRMEDRRFIRDFLECLLTPSELAEIARRWEVVKLLDQGVTQRRIADQLGMSLCKITRGSRELKKRDSAFRRVLHELL